MRLGTKILLSSIVIFVFIFCAAYLFFLFLGKTIIVKQLQGLTQQKVSIGHFNITPPLNIHIRNIKIGDLAKVDSLFVSPSVLGFLTGNIVFNEVRIIKPDVTYERVAATAKESSGVDIPPAAGKSAAKSPAESAAKSSEKHPVHLIFKNLKVQDGRINFIDYSLGSPGIKITVKDINFKLTNLYTFPRSVVTNFELSGRIPWQEGKKEGKIEAEGWLNILKKNIEANLKIEDIDGISLYPYYLKWVDLEKARIEKANLNFTSNIHGLNNNIIADCRLELVDIVRKPRPPEEAEEKAERITTAVLETFKALNEGKIVLEFTIKTKMDKPVFGFGDIKMAFEDKFAKGRKASGFKPEDILGLPAKLVEGTVKGLTDMTTAVVSGTISAGKQIVKSVEGSFKKEKAE